MFRDAAWGGEEGESGEGEFDRLCANPQGPGVVSEKTGRGGGRRKTGRQVELAKAGQTLAQKRTNDSMDVAGVYL